jgi:hypothetical protein
MTKQGCQLEYFFYGSVTQVLMNHKCQNPNATAHVIEIQQVSNSQRT